MPLYSKFAICILMLLAVDAAWPAPPPEGMLERREIRAQLSPLRYTTLASEIGAKISRMPVAEGGVFRQGQLLIQFDCSLPQAQLAKAKAALSGTEETWQANQRLNELNSIGKLELNTSRSEMEKARAEVAANLAVLAKCSIAAPFSGRIAEQKVREQQYVQPGQALLDIIDDSALELEFIVPSKWLAWIRPGSRFEVSIDETARTYPARVQRIAARVDPVSQSVKINGVIDGRFNELMAGMSGKVVMPPPGNP
jgi:membrane fusion protein (multidrug efflux system)